MRRDQRSDQAQEYRRLYNSSRWKGPNGVRARQLAEQPLCESCLSQGRTTAATVCDHVDPKTKLDPATFFDGPFQSLCDQEPYRCHSRHKQSEERRAAQGKLPIQAAGPDGWPL